MPNREALTRLQKIKAFLLDILEHASDAIEEARHHSPESLENDSRTRKVILFDIFVVAEAVKMLVGRDKEKKQLGFDFRPRHRDVRWKNVVGFRDRNIHTYWETDTELLWSFLEELPKVVDAVSEELNILEET